MPLQEPSKIWHLGRWIYRPELPGKGASNDEIEIYWYNNDVWNKLIKSTPYWFELKLAEKEKKRASALKASHTRRARMKDALVEVVDPKVVYNRDGWICQLCNTPVSKLRDKNLVDIASLDHIIPLSKGGEHSYANTQLAHLSCNIRKGARTPKQ